jgi:hypothetical protein
MTKLIAIALIGLGAIGLAYGGFTYTKDRHTADIGAVHVTLDEKARVNVPVWAGFGGVLAGVLLLVAAPRRG